MVSKIVESAQNVMAVPVSSVASPLISSYAGLVFSNRWFHVKPSVLTSTSTALDSAFTTEMPTPCRPPDTA